MRPSVFTMMSLVCATADAQVYRCPAEDAGVGLTNAEIRIGSRNDAYALHGDVDQVRGGTKIHFNLPEEAPRWLVCQYGGRRIDGTVISAPVVISGREAWIQLDLLNTECDLMIRETKLRGRDTTGWSASVICKKQEPPPPDLV